MLRRAAVALLLVTAACAAPSADDEQATAGSDIVGGVRDLRWPSHGYLVSGKSEGAIDKNHPSCSATLIAPNVAVTAAHCLAREGDAFWAFGSGDVGSSALVKVVERHLHPEFHPRPDGMIDIPYVLRKNDVAWVVLERPLAITPAALPDRAPEVGCNVQAIGYHADAAGKPSSRKSTPACVEFNVSLGDDPIFEVHPQNKSGLCNADGDEGSPVVLRDASRDVLVGFYVGSVTQFATDCVSSVQFLDGYESAFGYRDFFAAGIARGNELSR